MKLLLILVISVLLNIYNALGQNCFNIGFENGDATTWDLFRGEVNNTIAQMVNHTSETLSGGHHKIMGAGIDPVVGISTLSPTGGNYSLRIGDSIRKGGKAASITRTFFVDSSNSNLTYDFAVIMQDPGHSPNQMPFFKVNLYDSQGGSDSCAEYLVVSSGQLDSTWTAYQSGYYRDWHRVFVSLSPYIGTNVTLEVIVGDCSQGGHYGYAYFDAQCYPSEILVTDPLECEGDSAVLSAPPGAASYLWSNGATTQEITTATPGNYSVVVTPLQGSSCAITLEVELEGVVSQPIISFLGDTTCIGETFTPSSLLTTSPGVNFVSWEWDFGDGSPVQFGQGASHQYSSTGIYPVQLVIGQANSANTAVCTDTAEISVAVSGITADFSNTTVCEDTATQFTNNSVSASGTISQVSWDFESDGTIDATQTSPSNLYGTPGSYQATLIVANELSCIDTLVRQVVIHASPMVDFSSTFVCEGTVTQFTNNTTTSSGVISQTSWDFTSDGIIDNVTFNPSNGYFGAGNYMATLYAENSFGCVDSVTQLVVVNPVPQSLFTSDTVCAGNATGFTDQSTLLTGGIVSYNWDFNDGGASSINQNPSHVFSSPGTYNVTLQIQSDSGCVATSVSPVFVPDNPLAAFNHSNVCFLDSVPFQDQSVANANMISSWSWDFESDGTVDASQASPSNLYATPGTYLSTLVVFNDMGCSDTVSHQVDIYELPVANFSGQNVCEGSAVNFTDLSTVSSGNSIVSYSWDLSVGNSSLSNPSQIYITQGTYAIELIVTSQDGCKDTSTLSIEIYPVPVADFTHVDVCDGVSMNMTDNSTVNNGNIVSWQWDYGDGFSGNTQNTSHLYSNFGTYNVNLLVATANACLDSISIPVTVHPNPIVDFGSPNPMGCSVWCVDFENYSSISSGTLSYSWDFGDGTSSSGINPTHCYANTSLNDMLFDVSLTAMSSEGCSSDTIKTGFVTVYPLPTAIFTPSVTEVSEYLPVVDFTNGSIIGDSYYWDFGDFTNSTNVHTSHVYSSDAPSSYLVCLTAETIHGCLDETCQEIRVLEEASIFVPNAFTPDGDGVNDYFFPEHHGISEEGYRLYVFDRWGELIYSTKSLSDKWNGRIRGVMARDDVYVWKIDAIIKHSGERIEKIGHVTLLK